MLILHFFYWHWVVAVKKIQKIWWNFSVFFWHFFSIGLLLKTFFLPWRRIITLKQEPGFDIKEFLERLLFNIFGRILGMLLRSFVILIGLIVELIVLILGPIVTITWILLPFLIYPLFQYTDYGTPASLILILILIFLYFQIYIKAKPWVLYPSINRLGIGNLQLGYLLDWPAAKIVAQALRKSETSKQLEVLVRKTLKEPDIEWVFKRLGLEIKEARKMEGPFRTAGYPILYLFKTAFDSAKARSKFKIEVGDFLFALASLETNFQRFFFSYEIKPEDIFNVTFWLNAEKTHHRQKRKFWEREYLLRVPGLAKSWAYGYTVTLDKFSSDLTQQIKKQDLDFKVFVHQKEIDLLEQALARAAENNALLIGRPGIGKTAIVLGLTKLIMEGKSLPILEHKRVLKLDLNLLTSGIVSANTLKERLITIFAEAQKAGNIILVVPDFHNLINPEVVHLNLFEIIVPYLASKNFQLIGLTDFRNYHHWLEPNAQLLKFFERIEVIEPNKKQTTLILEDMVGQMEKRAGLTVSYQAIVEAVEKSNLYIQDVPYPEKAIDVLDEAIVYVATKTQDKFVSRRHINQVLSQRSGVPLGKIGGLEKKELLNLEESLHQLVVNQEEAIKSVANALRRSRTGLTKKDRPIGSFLFLGPTGVGKTSVARALAKVYFGSEDKMIRLDMSEFKDSLAVEKLIGSFHQEKPGILLSAIRERPFTLVLLDEVEKAAPQILDLFLEMLDEGRMRDAFGQAISFRNCIIIATSNAGAELIRQAIEKNINLQKIKRQILDYLQSQRIFKPEFLNRFDGIVLFQPLGQDDLLEIADMQLGQLNERLKKEQDITLTITDDLKKKIVELGYDPVYGARPMQRVIQDKIESLIAKKILEEEVKRGSEIVIRPEEVS